MTVETEKTTEEHVFEFLLYINDHIICQRFLNIRNYNEDSINSLKVKELMDSIIGLNNGKFGELGIIPNHLKQKTLNYMWETYNPYLSNNEDTYKGNSDKIDNFQFEIRIDGKTIGKGEFSGNLFPPKVRYAVDIKEIIPLIVNEIRYYLSLKKYTKVSA